MRYTRYEYKKSGRVKFLSTILLVAVISVTGGLYISNVVFKGKEIPTVKKMQRIESDSSQNQNLNNINMMAIQCGYYTKKENAEAEITKLSSYCKPFIFEKNNTYRVMAGIYNEDIGMKKIEQLKLNGIDVAKVSLDLPNNTEADKKVIEVIDGFLKITDKFDEQDVQSIKTLEFKNWTDSIINDNGPKNEKVERIENCIKNLPEELDRNNVSQNIQEIYSIVKSE